MRTKLSELRQAVNSCIYDVIVLVESWLNDDYLEPELGFCDFIVFRQDRSHEKTGKTRGGGTLIAVRKCLKARMIQVSDSVLEHVFVNVSFGSRKIILGAVYIPPSSPNSVYEEFSSSASELLAGYSSCDILVCGDFNLPSTVWINSKDGLCVESAQSVTSANLLCACCNYLNLCQVNCISNKFGNFLDLVFTSLLEAQVCIASENLLNVTERHLAYEILLPMDCGIGLKYDVFYYDFKSCNFEAINSYFASVPWEYALDSNDINISDYP